MNSVKTLIPMVAALSVGTTALAQINYVSRESDISAWADLGESDFDSDSDSSTTFLPFASGVSAVAGNAEVSPFAYATATAYQTSSLSAAGISYTGSLMSSAQEYGYAEANTYFSVTFNVDSPVTFSLSGGSALSSGPVPLGGIARMELEFLDGISLTGGEFDNFWAVGEAVDLTGTFEPGVDYTLTADFWVSSQVIALRSQLGGISPARALFTDSESFESSLELSLSSPVPEAGTSAAVAGLVGLALWQWRRRQA